MTSRPLFITARPRDADGAILSTVAYFLVAIVLIITGVALCADVKWGGLLPFFLGWAFFYVFWENNTKPAY
jgi:hypothetical protein